MAYTREQWVNGALQELGVVGAGQTASAEDAKAVDDRIPSVMDDLAIRSVWVVGDPDQIDAAAYNHLVLILAQAVARQFGMAPSEEIRLLSEARLRHLRAEDLSGQAQQANYY